MIDSFLEYFKGSTFDSTYFIFEDFFKDYIGSKFSTVASNFSYFFRLLSKFISNISFSYDVIYIFLTFLFLFYIDKKIYDRYIKKNYSIFTGINDIALISCIFSIAILSTSILYMVNKLVIITIISIAHLDISEAVVDFIILLTNSTLLIYGIWNFDKYISKTSRYVIYTKYLLIAITFKQILSNVVIYITDGTPEIFTTVCDQILGFVLLIFLLSSERLIRSISIVIYIFFLVNPDLVILILWIYLVYLVVSSFCATIDDIYNKTSQIYNKYFKSRQGLLKFPHKLLKFIFSSVIILLSYLFYKNNISRIDGTISKQFDYIFKFDGIFDLLVIWITSWIVLWILFVSSISIAEEIMNKYHKKDKYKKYISNIMTLIKSTLIIVFLLIGISIILISLGYGHSVFLIFGIFGGTLFISGKKFIENVVSGFMVLNNNKLIEGDVIEVNGILGKIEEITLLTIHLRLPTGGLLILPFSKVETVINNTRSISYSSTICIKISVPSTVLSIDDMVSKVDLILRKSEYKEFISEIKNHGVVEISINTNIFIVCGKMISDVEIQEKVSRFCLLILLRVSKKCDINIMSSSISFIPVYS